MEHSYVALESHIYGMVRKMTSQQGDFQVILLYGCTELAIIRLEENSATKVTIVLITWRCSSNWTENRANRIELLTIEGIHAIISISKTKNVFVED